MSEAKERIRTIRTLVAIWVPAIAAAYTLYQLRALPPDWRWVQAAVTLLAGVAVSTVVLLHGARPRRLTDEDLRRQQELLSRMTGRQIELNGLPASEDTRLQSDALRGLKMMTEGKWQRAIGTLSAVLDRADPKHRVILRNMLGVCYHELWSPREALRPYERALALAKDVGDKSGAAAIQSNMAILAREEGRLTEAESGLRGALEFLTTAETKDEGDRASILYHLAWTIHRAEKYTEAETMYRQALEIRERLLGPEDPATADTLGGLGELLSEEGRFDEAEPLLWRALSVQERTLGRKHKHVATTLNNLGLLKLRQRKMTEATQLLARALHVSGVSVGRNHPSSARIAMNLADAYSQTGNYDKSMRLIDQALRVLQVSLPEDHELVARAMNAKAECLRLQRRFNEAAPLYKSALEKLEGRPTGSTLLRATILSNWGLSLSQQDRVGEATKLLLPAIEVFESTLGPVAPETTANALLLATIYDRASKSDIVDLDGEPVPTAQSGLPPLSQYRSPVFLLTLGGLRRIRGDFRGAIACCRRALTYERERAEPVRVFEALILNDLAEVLRQTSDDRAAERFHTEALEIRRSQLGEDSPDVATSKNNLGVLYMNGGDFGRATTLLEDALALRRKLLGERHRLYAQSLNNLGTLRTLQGRLDEAEVLIEEAYSIRLAELNSSDPDLAESLFSRAALRRARGDHAGAAAMLGQALSTFERTLGHDHPFTKCCRAVQNSVMGIKET